MKKGVPFRPLSGRDARTGRSKPPPERTENAVNIKNAKVKRESLIRLIILFFGLAVAHLGVTLFLLSQMGSDPFNVLIQGLHLLSGRVFDPAPTHGTVHMCVCFLIILILLFTDRSYVRAGTLVCMFCGGPIIDFFTWLLGGLGISESALIVKIPVLVLGCVILAFGMSVVIRSEAGTGPNDLVAVVISDKTHIRFSFVRIAADVVFVLAGILSGGRAGAGTVICAFLVGPVAEFCMPFSSSLVSNTLRRCCPQQKIKNNPS